MIASLRASFALASLALVAGLSCTEPKSLIGTWGGQQVVQDQAGRTGIILSELTLNPLVYSQSIHGGTAMSTVIGAYSIRGDSIEFRPAERRMLNSPGETYVYPPNTQERWGFEFRGDLLVLRRSKDTVRYVRR